LKKLHDIEKLNKDKKKEKIQLFTKQKKKPNTEESVTIMKPMSRVSCYKGNNNQEQEQKDEKNNEKD